MQKPVLKTANPKALKIKEPELIAYRPSLPSLVVLKKWKDYGPFHIGEKKAKRKQAKVYQHAILVYKKNSIRYERQLARFNKRMGIYEKDSVSRRQVAQYLFDLRQYYGTFNLKVLQKTLKDKANISEKEIATLKDKIFKKAEREYRAEFEKYASINYDFYAFDDAKVFDDSLIRMGCQIIEMSKNSKKQLAILYKPTAYDTLRIVIQDVVALKRMGWINCDAFETPMSERMQVQVEEPNINTQLSLYVSSKKSLMRLNPKQGFHDTPMIPKRLKGVYIALKIEDGTTFFAKRETEGIEIIEDKLDYKEILLADLREEFSHLRHY
jgi:hypothetical protein